MAIEDSNPERRNLTVLSSAIIIYYLGEGKIQENTLTLEIVNVVFSNTEMLTIIVWVMLGWFTFRYLIENRYRIPNELKIACEGKDYLLSFFSAYLINHIQKTQEPAPILGPGKFTYRCESYDIELSSTSTDFLADYVSIDGTKTYLGVTRIEGTVKILLYFLLSIRLFFIEPNVTRNLIPLILPLFAAWLGISDYFNAEEAGYYLNVQKFLVVPSDYFEVGAH